MTDTSIVADIVHLVRSARVDLSSEKAAQDDLEKLLDAAGIPYAREVRLSGRDIVDFTIGLVALELKLKGANKKSVYRQLCRYAKHDGIETIVLASNLSMGLPPTIEGKPAYFVRLGEGWL